MLETPMYVDVLRVVASINRLIVCICKQVLRTPLAWSEWDGHSHVSRILLADPRVDDNAADLVSSHLTPTKTNLNHLVLCLYLLPGRLAQSQV